MTDRMKGKVAIVVGAGSIGPGWGNGKATAVAFAREGARVLCVDINPAAAEETAGIIQAEGGTAVVLSSHQLDLVDDICEEVAIISNGTLALGGSLRGLKNAATRRLVIELKDAGPNWHVGLPLAGITGDVDGRIRIEVDGVDPQVILDRARAAGRVEHFALERPTLGELFLQAVTR